MIINIYNKYIHAYLQINILNNIIICFENRHIGIYVIHDSIKYINIFNIKLTLLLIYF